MDRTVCFNLGRPLTLTDDHIDALFPAETETEPNGSSQASIALALHHVRLRKIQSRIICEVYVNGTKLKESTSNARRLQKIQDIHDTLDDWRHELSLIYKAEHTPHTFDWYERLYYTTIAVLYRATPLFPVPPEDMIQKCYQASSKALTIYYSLLRTNEMEPSWMLIQGCFLAGITMLYAVWSCPGLSRTVRLEEITERCRICSVVLAALSAKWNVAGGVSDTFEKLANATTRKLVTQLQWTATTTTPAVVETPAAQQLSSIPQAVTADPISVQPTIPFPDLPLPVPDWPSALDLDAAFTDEYGIPGIFEDIFNGQNTFMNL